MLVARLRRTEATMSVLMSVLMSVVGPTRPACVCVAISLLGRARHTRDAPGSYTGFLSSPHGETPHRVCSP